jgi:surfeit locus 1 family protein
VARPRTYRFLLTPKWVTFTVLVIAVVAGCLAAASWQWGRLQERRDRNAEIVAKQSVAPVPLTEAIGMDATLAEGADAQWTVVTVTGEYDPAGEVLVRNRAYDELPGVHVVTPLRLTDGSGGAVLVNRGWLPRPPNPAQAIIPPKPLTGPVTVVGRVRATQERGRFGPEDPESGVLREVARVDVERLRSQSPYPLAPVFLELISQEPTDPVGPTPVRPPALDDGPHLSYAGQWLLFAILAVVGWVIVVRKTAVGRRQMAARDAAVQTAIARRSATAIPLRNVKPVKRAAEPPSEPVTADVGPPAPPLLPADEAPAEEITADGDRATSSAPAGTAEPVVTGEPVPTGDGTAGGEPPGADRPVSAGPEAGDQPAHVAGGEPGADPPGSSGEHPPHQ